MFQLCNPCPAFVCITDTSQVTKFHPKKRSSAREANKLHKFCSDLLIVKKNTATALPPGVPARNSRPRLLSHPARCLFEAI